MCSLMKRKSQNHQEGKEKEDILSESTATTTVLDSEERQEVKCLGKTMMSQMVPRFQ